MRLLIIFLFISSSSFGGTVDTVLIQSESMHNTISCVVIRPGTYKSKRNHFPVVYLLHGYSGNYANWITKAPELKLYADQYNIMIVCPDGNSDSWYFDSPLDSNYRYETHVCREVVPYIDSHYRTLADASHRAITGLSMGGHGALYLALRHADLFGAAGSMSGGLELKDSKNRFDISKRIGDTLQYAQNWHDMTVVNLVDKYPGTHLRIIFDCGIRDFFLNGNRKLHEKLIQLNIPHDYTERPGEHNWDYWLNSLPYHLLFFQRYFGRK